MATKREKDFLHNLDKRMSVLEEVIKRLESNSKEKTSFLNKAIKKAYPKSFKKNGN